MSEAATTAALFDLSAEPIDAAVLERQLQHPEAGALATFQGWVRNHADGRQVTLLEYQVYPDLARREGERVVAEALQKFNVVAARCVHRHGTLHIGDIAVWVGVVAAHRGDAFSACRYVIDEIKERLPIWKRETYADGDSGWVNCQVRVPE